MADKSIISGDVFVYPSESIFQKLEQTVRKFATNTAIIFSGKEILYGDFLHLVEQLSAVLHHNGIQKGDRVAVMLPNCPQYVAAFYACARIGAIVVQVNPMYVNREVEYTLDDSDAKAMVTLEQFYPKLQELERIKKMNICILVNSAKSSLTLPPNGVFWDHVVQQSLVIPEPAQIQAAEDVAVIQYTGGTTGRSKGAMLTHQNIVANTIQSIVMLGNDSITANDKVLAVLPLFHVYGMTVAMNFAIFSGAAMILLPRFQIEEVLQTIKVYQPRFFPGVPTMYVAIANYPNVQSYGVDCIEICLSGSAPLPLEVMKAFELVTGAKLLEGYGLSEASPVTHVNRVNIQRKPGSIGLAAIGTDAGIVDLATGTEFVEIGQLGELVVRGPQVMKGYWNMPEETAHTLRNGWLYTGDIGRMDEDGYFYIMDRKKDLIISSGYNVYPRDVEEVLYQHPNVQEAVVVGVPDLYRGETVKTVIVLKQPLDTVDLKQIEEELDTWCRTYLAPYKVPKVYEFREELPKTAVGKILRRALRNI